MFLVENFPNSFVINAFNASGVAELDENKQNVITKQFITNLRRLVFTQQNEVKS